MLKQDLKDILKKEISKGNKYIVPYLTFGYPSLVEFEKIFLSISEEVELIEIGMPFSDPLADGKIIQQASSIALRNGASLNKLLETFVKLKQMHNSKLILMSYLNPCLRYGIDKLLIELPKAGFEAVIFPDLPYGINNLINKNSTVKLVYLISPTTPMQRAKEILNESNPFAYAVSVKGVTGIRQELPQELPNWLSKLKKLSSTPLFVGFGISNPNQLIAIKDNADGFIIGSAIIKLISDNKSNQIKNFINEMKLFIK